MTLLAPTGGRPGARVVQMVPPSGGPLVAAPHAMIPPAVAAPVAAASAVGPSTTDAEAVQALKNMSPARRAAQLFTATLTNAGNTATFGGLGAIGDLVRGVPIGTTASQLHAQVRAASPTADTAGSLIALAGAGGAVKAAAPRLVQGAKALVTAGPAVGTRAAALGASGGSTYLGTAAKVLGPLAGALGLGAYLNADSAPAAAATPPGTSPAAARAAQIAAAAPADATPQTPQDALGSVITRALANGASFNEIKELGALVPAAVKPTTSAKDNRVATAGSVADQLYQGELAQAANEPDEEKKRKAIQDATARYFANNAALVGVNPQAYAMSQMLGDQEQ